MISALPEHPDLVLRLGFAGQRWGSQLSPSDEKADAGSKLPAAPPTVKRLQEGLDHVLSVIEERLKEIGHSRSGIARYYSKNQPLLRLITGLAEGADQLAANALLNRPTDCAVRRELAAVLPVDIGTYRASREAWHRPDFDATLGRCSYVLELDGIYEKPNPDTDTARLRRTRAYRAQSTLLLRQCDMLVAITNPEDHGRAGGTLETVQNALAFETPVILLDASTGVLHLLQPGDDTASLVGLAPAGVPGFEERLRTWVTILVADPDLEKRSPHAEPADHSTEEEFLEEFFDQAAVPPTNTAGKRQASRRERFAKRVDGALGATPGSSDAPLSAFARYRDRARGLNYHFAGLYRGTFLLNYTLAVVAVALAALSLVLLGKRHTPEVGSVVVGVEAPSQPETNPTPALASTAAGHAPPPISPAGHPLRGDFHFTPLDWLLLGLALTKLGIVIFIYRNTQQANSRHWNDKAIDYRYLAERLRAAFYLPRFGSFQPPSATKPQFAPRALRQSAVDWLFDALMRHTSPEQIESLRVQPSGAPSAGPVVLRVEADSAFRVMRDNWIGGQQAYHEANARRLRRMNQFCEDLGRWLSIIVIGAVALDVGILILYWWRLLPADWSASVHRFAPWLVFLAALLPAAVAALSGIRFQSESRRLADRSLIMQELLARSATRSGLLADEITRRRATPATDPGSWTPDMLRLAEDCAQEMVEEVAEWSALYSKEVFDP